MNITIDMREVEAFARRFAHADEVFAEEIEQTMQKSIDLFQQAVTTSTPVNTGTLRASIATQMYGVPLGTLMGEITTSSPYGEAVEYGRKPGRMPPTAAIKTWVVRKGIAGGDDADRVAYLIARAIGRRGTKGAGMFKRAFDQRYSTAVTNRVLLLWYDMPERIMNKLGASS